MPDTSDRIPVPSFDLGPPNLFSTRERQEKGLCAIHDCPNPFEGEYWEGRWCYCREHREKIDTVFRRWYERLDREDLNRLLRNS